MIRVTIRGDDFSAQVTECAGITNEHHDQLFNALRYALIMAQPHLSCDIIGVLAEIITASREDSVNKHETEADYAFCLAAEKYLESKKK